MSENQIDSLTPEQEALIPVYREKWRNILYSTEPIDCDKAAETLKRAYAAIGQPEPAIYFFDSPYQALTDTKKVFKKQRDFTKYLYLSNCISKK